MTDCAARCSSGTHEAQPREARTDVAQLGPPLGGVDRREFAFEDAERTNHETSKLWRAVDVSRAGYYVWRERAPSKHADRYVTLTVLVREAHERSRKTYGSLRSLGGLRKSARTRLYRIDSMHE